MTIRAELTPDGIALISTETIGRLSKEQVAVLTAMAVAEFGVDAPSVGFELYGLGLAGPMGHGRFEINAAGRAVVNLLNPEIKTVVRKHSPSAEWITMGSPVDI